MQCLILIMPTGPTYQATGYVSGLPIYRAEGCGSAQAAVDAIQTEHYQLNQAKILWKVHVLKPKVGQPSSNMEKASLALLSSVSNVTKEGMA